MEGNAPCLEDIVSEARLSARTNPTLVAPTDGNETIFPGTATVNVECDTDAGSATEGPTEPTAEETSPLSKKSTIVSEVNVGCNGSLGD